MCDGDVLNVVTDPVILSCAKRHLQQLDILPLAYDAYKASAEQLSRENMYLGLKRAHDYSGIGNVSNMLTRLWNKDKPNLNAAANITCYNNQVSKIAPSYSDVRLNSELRGKPKRKHGNPVAPLMIHHALERLTRSDSLSR